MRRADPPALGGRALHPEGRRVVCDRLPLRGPEEGDRGGEEGEWRRGREPGPRGGEGGRRDLDRGVLGRRGRRLGKADHLGVVQLTGAPGPTPSRCRALPPRTNTSTRPELSTRAPSPWRGRSA